MATTKTFSENVIQRLEQSIKFCENDAADFAKKAAVNPFYAVKQEGTGMLLVGARWDKMAELLKGVNTIKDESLMKVALHEYKDAYLHTITNRTSFMPNCTDAIVNVANCAEFAAVQEMYKFVTRLLNHQLSV